MTVRLDSIIQNKNGGKSYGKVKDKILLDRRYGTAPCLLQRHAGIRGGRRDGGTGSVCDVMGAAAADRGDCAGFDYKRSI